MFTQRMVLFRFVGPVIHLTVWLRRIRPLPVLPSYAG